MTNVASSWLGGTPSQAVAVDTGHPKPTPQAQQNHSTPLANPCQPNTAPANSGGPKGEQRRVNSALGSLRSSFSQR
eukprot:15430311-Alexandrium_andersonii.AAC.1